MNDISLAILARYATAAPVAALGYTLNLTGTITAGTRTITPPAMSGTLYRQAWAVSVNDMLIVDGGSANQETIVVTAVTSSTFTATFSKTHPPNPIARFLPPIYAGLAPAGTSFPYFLYSGGAGATIQKFYDGLTTFEPFILQFDCYAAGKDANKLPLAGAYMDALCGVFDAVKSLNPASGLALTLYPVLKRMPVYDSLDPKTQLPVFHAVSQYRCTLQTLIS